MVLFVALDKNTQWHSTSVKSTWHVATSIPAVLLYYYMSVVSGTSRWLRPREARYSYVWFISSRLGSAVRIARFSNISDIFYSQQISL